MKSSISKFVLIGLMAWPVVSTANIVPFETTPKDCAESLAKYRVARGPYKDIVLSEFRAERSSFYRGYHFSFVGEDSARNRFSGTIVIRNDEGFSEDQRTGQRTRHRVCQILGNKCDGFNLKNTNGTVIMNTCN